MGDNGDVQKRLKELENKVFKIERVLKLRPLTKEEKAERERKIEERHKKNPDYAKGYDIETAMEDMF